MNNAEAILDSLYRRHYLVGQPSESTSSHWRSIGWHRVAKSGRGWELDGAGFGSRRSDTWLNRLARWPSTRLTFDLLSQNKCPADLVELGMDVARSHGRLFDYDCARQVMTLALLISRVPGLSREVRFEVDFPIAIIGDGYGYLGSLIGAWLPKSRVVEINLGRTLLFDAYYLMQAFPGRRHALYGQGVEAGDTGSFVYLEAESVRDVRSLDARLFINIVSMQEMDPPIVRDYFRLMRAAQTEERPYFTAATARKNGSRMGRPQGSGSTAGRTMTKSCWTSCAHGIRGTRRAFLRDGRRSMVRHAIAW